MKFHFIAAVDGDKESYKLIFKLLEELGCQPVTDHVLVRTMKQIDKETPEESEDYVNKMHNWIRRADFMVFEVTKNEFGCGCEMMITLEKGKPALVLYDSLKGKIPPTLKGYYNERLFIYSYEKRKTRELKQTLRFALQEIKQQNYTRFTLLLPPEITSFLNNLYQKKKIPRSVFIRNLIEREMGKEK